MGLLLLAGLINWRAHALTYPLDGPAMAALTVLALLDWRRWYTVKPWPLRAIARLGVISYGAYIWNYPITIWLRATMSSPGPPAAALTLIAAALSWHFIESPALGRWGRPRIPGRHRKSGDNLTDTAH